VAPSFVPAPAWVPQTMSTVPQGTGVINVPATYTASTGMASSILNANKPLSSDNSLVNLNTANTTKTCSISRIENNESVNTNNNSVVDGNNNIQEKSNMNNGNVSVSSNEGVAEINQAADVQTVANKVNVEVATPVTDPTRMDVIETVSMAIQGKNYTTEPVPASKYTYSFKTLEKFE